MRNEFCTLFDVNYLPRGLVLYRSLADVCSDFRLRVFCMDDEVRELLDRLALPRLVPISLAELEAHDPALRAVKPTRTQVEYCWTATPAVCLHALERERDLDQITYLDADLMFFSEPAPVFDELAGDSVLIVPHRYASQWRHSEATSGRFNVQFLTFKRDERGLEVLRWWHDRCIEWCYARVEDGKMGDQKYLDEWPERFSGVHVLEHPGGGLAPWNVSRYELARQNGRVLVDGRPLVFYHYHSLRLLQPTPPARAAAALLNGYRFRDGPAPVVWTTSYPMSPPELQMIWEPYLEALQRELVAVRRAGSRFYPGFLGTRESLRDVVRYAEAGVRARGKRLLHRLDRRRHTGSWKSDSVAGQMRALAQDQLDDPESVPPYRAFLDAIAVLVGGDFELPEPARLLDFGCGTGHYSELLERRFRGRFEYTGCDFAPEMIAAAREQWPGRTFLVNDLFDNWIDLSDFHVLLAAALVDVLPDYERALDLLLGSRVPYVLLHRQQVTDGRSRAEVAPGYSGQRTHRTYLNRRDLEAAAARHGREVARTFHVEGSIFTFLLARRTSL
jgi:SAM-dependent methyltransferase